jgi:protein phosphatase
MNHPLVDSALTATIRPRDLDTAMLPAQRPSLAVRSFGLTDQGKVRTANEDQFLIAVMSKTLQMQQTSLPQPRVLHGSEQGHLFAVADGMGGHAGGEQASSLALDTIGNFAVDTLKWFRQLQGKEGDKVLAEFQQAVGQADAKILAEAAQRPELHGMGTTLTMAYSLADELFVAHVGDSRCYLLRQGLLYQLTRDHTMVQEMVRMGVIQPGEAAHHKLRHVITNVVGGHEEGIQVEVHKIHIEPDDVVLLCTDGLSEMVPNEEIATILHKNPNPESACRTLVDRANEQGGKDNITIVVVRYEMPTE